MAEKDRDKWNSKYEATDCLAGRDPCEWLSDHAHLLTGGGKALDIAMGEGRNAIYLASLGYEVVGVDISDVAIHRAHKTAREKEVTIQTEVSDLDNYKIGENEYDVIICFYFLDRNLFSQIRRGLKPGGLLIFETFNVEYLKYSTFKRDWVLARNELLEEFGDWHVLNYREVDEPDNEKAYSSIVVRKKHQE